MSKKNGRWKTDVWADKRRAVQDWLMANDVELFDSETTTKEAAASCSSELNQRITWQFLARRIPELLHRDGSRTIKWDGKHGAVRRGWHALNGMEWDRVIRATRVAHETGQLRPTMRARVIRRVACDHLDRVPTAHNYATLLRGLKIEHYELGET